MFQLLILLCIAFFTGCSNGFQTQNIEEIQTRQPFATLEVDNENWSQVTVYSGARRRLGAVPAVSKATLKIWANDVDSDGTLTIGLLTFVSNTSATLESVNVREGQVVHVHVFNELSHSYAVVWKNGN
jgi:hypothetical protein